MRFLCRHRLLNKKKLLWYVFQEPWRNEETISTLGTYLPQKQAEAKEMWHKASVAYQDGYRLDNERNNKKLLSAVKQTKTKYERWGKIITHFETLKTKNRV